MMPGRRPEKLPARATEPPATTGPTTPICSFCTVGDPSNPVFTVTSRLAGIGARPVAETAPPLAPEVGTETMTVPDWGLVDDETGATSPDNIGPVAGGESRVEPEDIGAISLKASAGLWPTALSTTWSWPIAG